MVYAIAKRVPYAAHVIILFTFAFSAFVLVILCTFSSPFIRSINFLSIPSGGDVDAIRTTFGAFGWCAPDFCLPSAIGYEYGTQVNKALTSAMILWAISIIFLFFTTISILPLLFVHQSKALRYIGNSQFFLFCAWLSMLLVSLAWVMSIYGWSIAHRAFELTDADANLGSAMWLGLTAAILSVIIAFLGWPVNAWDGAQTRADGGVGARGLPGDGYYHHKRTVREVVPRY